MTTSPDTGRSAAGLRERKKARTRASIRQHALRLFREQGYAATTVDHIAEAAEVSQSTFFRYFPTKEDVVLQDDYDPLIIAAFRAQPAELTPIAALRGAMHAVFSDLTAEARAQERDRGSLILSVPELRAAMLDQFAGTVRLLTEVVAERVGRRPDELAVRNFAGAVIGVAIAAMIAAMEDPGADMFALMDAGLAHLELGVPL
jgi:AcrR family transcriptional regulator